MSLDERITWLLIGVVIGYILGRLRDIRRKEEEILERVEEVDEHVKNRRARDEGGFMRYPVLADAFMLAVVVMTAWAAFVSQKAANESDANTEQLASVVSQLEDTQYKLEAVTSCNTLYQSRTIRALNERTEYTAKQALANVQLQKAQAAFLQIALIIPPVTPAELREALERYYGSLGNFVQVSKEQRQKTLEYAYPTNEELSGCITRAVESAAKKAKEKNE